MRKMPLEFYLIGSQVILHNYQTFVGFLLGMTSFMYFQLSTTQKTIPTEVAQVFLLAAMDEHVGV